MKSKFRKVYDDRWQSSGNTPDADILSFGKPRRQVELFYLMYNRFISKTIVDRFGNCENKQLLELGCGRATSSIYQSITCGINVTPTDYSSEALKIAEKNLNKYDVKAIPKNENIFDLGFSDCQFDVVISLGLMEHIEEAETAFREMLRVLKPRGLMITLNVPDHPDNIQRIAAPFNRGFVFLRNIISNNDAKPWLDSGTRSQTAGVYRSTLSGEGFGKIVKSAGFANVQVYEVNPFPTFDPVPDIVDSVIVKIYQVILFSRQLFISGNDSFHCGEKVSRANFVVGYKG